MKTQQRAIRRLATAKILTVALRKKPMADAERVVQTKFSMKKKKWSTPDRNPAQMRLDYIRLNAGLLNARALFPHVQNLRTPKSIQILRGIHTHTHTHACTHTQLNSQKHTFNICSILVSVRLSLFQNIAGQVTHIHAHMHTDCKELQFPFQTG